MDRMSALEPHIPALRRYALALLRRRDDADDLVQGCLLHAIDAMQTRRERTDLRAWLFSIMHNLFVDQWRARQRHRTVVVPDDAPDVATPPAQEDRLHLAEVLRRLDMLPDAQREVLLLVAVEGLDYATVGEILGVPLGTVMSRLSRARDGLRMAIGQPARRRAEA